MPVPLDQQRVIDVDSDTTETPGPTSAAGLDGVG